MSYDPPAEPPGYPPPGYQGMQPWAPQPAERTGRAVTALVLGLVGIITLITGPIAIIFGIAALAKARGRQLRGKGMAVAGLVLGILETLALVVVVAAIVAANTNSPKLVSSPPAPVASPVVNGTSPAPSPTSSLSGPVGTVYQVTDDSGDTMNVELTQVIDPAQGADQFTTPDNGNRFVGAVFTLKGGSGRFSDDANSDATLIGSDGQTYQPDFNSIRGHTNFNSGEFNVGPGEVSVGAVTFQVPSSVKVVKIEWSASAGFGGAPAEWVVR